MHKPTSRDRYNSYLFANNQRVVYRHPLLLTNDEIKLDKFITDNSAPDAKQHDDTILAKIKSLQELVNKSLPKGLTRFVLKPSRSKDKATLLWAMIPFDPKDEKNQRTVEYQIQPFVEALQSLGARYGISEKAYLFLLPGLEKIDSNTLTTTFANEIKLNWTRASSQFKSFGALSIPPFEYTILLKTRETQHPATQKIDASKSGTVKLATSLYTNSAENKTLDVIHQLTTIENDDERVLAAHRLNLGKPKDAGKFTMSSEQAELMYYIFLEYVQREQCPNIRYDKIENDQCLHPSLRLDAEETKKNVGCQSADIFVVCNLNPGIQPIVEKCIEAAEKTIREGRVSCTENAIIADGIYFLHGSGKNLRLELHTENHSETFNLKK